MLELLFPLALIRGVATPLAKGSPNPYADLVLRTTLLPTSSAVSKFGELTVLGSDPSGQV